MPQVIVELTQAQVDKIVADGSVLYPEETPQQLQDRMQAAAQDAVWGLGSRWARNVFDIGYQSNRQAAIDEHNAIFPGAVPLEGGQPTV